MSFRTKIVSYTHGSGIFWLLVVAISLVTSSYLYFVNQTIIRVAERNFIESKISEDKTEIADMESSYISRKNGITKELAQSLGYGDAGKTMFIQRQAVSVLARVNTVQ